MIVRNAKCKIANTVWKATCFPAYTRFRKALSDCEKTQQDYLSRLLRYNDACLYGREHGFSAIRSASGFQKNLPLTSYEDYLPYIERIAQGEKLILTKDDVLLFEPSSGTSSCRKLIPYTARLKNEFQNGIGPWIVSLFSQFPELSGGRAYWSISPPNAEAESTHGIMPVGFDSDWGYLGTLGKIFHSCIAVSPKGIAEKTDAAGFRNATLACLLSAQDLSLISVWSPSFLRLMLDWYIRNADEVLEAMMVSHDGSQKRVDNLRQLGCRRDIFEQVWPQLKVISCWTDAASKHEAERLAEFLPSTHIQSKGLISTEAFVSLPFSENHDPVLAVTSHFFEFLTEGGDTLMAHELEKDCEYSVVVTTGGGLYRYRLEDRILVTGFVGNTPTIRFVGKSELVSDRYGEKLNAVHISEVLHSLLANRNVDFAMLAPDNVKGSYAYTLYLQSRDQIPRGASGQLDALLQANPNYRTCIALGQLRPARVFKVEGDACAAYEARCIELGLRHGDVKAAALSAVDNWTEVFHGKYM